MGAELRDLIQGQRIVVFAGAGISMGEPSSLPNWWDLNEWILAALYARVQAEFGIDQDFSKILLDYRNNSNSFPPDYQAQFMEECAGSRYFEALSALDIAVTNRCHTAIASLAHAGHLAAIVTTNFDCLIEAALTRANVLHQVVCAQAEFEQLYRELMVGSVTSLPVIKIHGSTKNVDSMVDTRKQRRRGRSRALNAILAHLLRQYRFLFAGFSGADFEHDKHYLGIWDARDTAPGFIFLFQPGASPKSAVFNLKDHYAEKASLIEVDAAAALESVSATVDTQSPIPAASRPTQEVVQERLSSWSRSLDTWLALRIGAALQEAASLRVNALALLKCGIRQRAADTPEYLLFLADWVRARLRRARYDDIEVRTAIRRLVENGHPLGNYYQLLSDAFSWAGVFGLRSVHTRCLQFTHDYQQLIGEFPPIAAVDAVLIMCQVASLFRELPELKGALRFACAKAEQDGDDVRLAVCRAELVIRLAILGQHDEADVLFNNAMAVAQELTERRVAATAVYAYALMQESRGVYPEAMGTGHLAFQHAIRDELRLGMSRALLIQLRVAAYHGGRANMQFVRDQINHQLPHQFWAHQLEHDLYEAVFARRMQEPDAAQRLVTISSEAQRLGLQWIVAAVAQAAS